MIDPLTGQICPHFGECGGCASQDVPYEQQVRDKAAQLETLFEPFWSEPIAVHPSPTPSHYRNKVELNFGRKHYPEPPPKGFVKETVLGFKKRGRWYWTLDIDECRIASPELASLLPSLRRWYTEANLRAWDSRRRDGILRHLVVREGKRTGDRMVVLITAEGEIDEQAFAKAVLRSYPATSIFRGVNRSRGDQARADDLSLLHGTPHIEERLRLEGGDGGREIRFAISPFGFFQTNTLATEVLYGLIRDWCRRAAPRTLYDLYGGSGGIAFFCADLVDSVHSVESWERASLDGQLNARANHIENVDFIAEPVEDFLGHLELDPDRSMEGSAVVLDPPRAGLHPKALGRLLSLRPPRLLYVSCKPPVLTHDLERLTEAYRLTDLYAVDLFPQTPHVEAVAELVVR